MKRIGKLMAGGVGALGLLLLANCGGEALEGDAEQPTYDSASARRGVVPGRYIVVLKEGAQGLVAMEPLVRRAEALGGSVGFTYQATLRGFSAALPEEAVAALRADPQVAQVEPVRYVHLDASQQNATWGLDRIDQRNLPVDRTYNYNFTGAGVDAFIIDTGIRSAHSEFGGRVKPGFTAVNDGRGTEDCNGHGTHVSGTVGGRTYGVAKEVTLYPARVFGCSGEATDEQVIAAVDWVTSKKQPGRPAVANMSLGGEASPTLDAALVKSIQAGVVYAVAAGNESQNACNVSPARVPEAITVGSSNSSDWRSGFSNFGRCVDIFAPGSGITSAWSTSNSATARISGTSMASPHVAGAAALVLQQNPTLNAAGVAQALRTLATPNKLFNAGSGSPNLLLYTPR